MNELLGKVEVQYSPTRDEVYVLRIDTTWGKPPLMFSIQMASEVLEDVDLHDDEELQNHIMVQYREEILDLL